MRYFVTGGSGFIGTQIVSDLVQSGHTVVNLDLSEPRFDAQNYQSYDSEPRFHDSEPNWPNIQGHIYCHGSVQDVDLVRDIMFDFRPDRVIHLASLIGIKHYINSASSTIDTILTGTRNVAEACRDSKTPFLTLSTSEAYGKSLAIPMKESDDLVYGSTENRRWVYGMAKALSEHLVMDIFQDSYTPYVIIRPFNVVGKEQSLNSGLVFPVFLNQVLNGGPITVHNQGEQTRTFCGVKDFARGVVAIFDRIDSDSHESRNRVINLGSARELSMLELAKMFQASAKSILGKDIDIELVPYKSVYPHGFEDLERRVPDVSLARQIIGWDSDSLVSIEALIEEALIEEALSS